MPIESTSGDEKGSAGSMIMSDNYIREGVKVGIYESGSRTMDARPRSVCGKGINRLNPKSLTVAYSTSISTRIVVPAAAAAGSAGGNGDGGVRHSHASQ